MFKPVARVEHAIAIIHYPQDKNFNNSAYKVFYENEIKQALDDPSKTVGQTKVIFVRDNPESARPTALTVTFKIDGVVTERTFLSEARYIKMITENFTLANRLFTIVDEGIADGYDFFSYKVDIGDGYIDAVLTVENEGVVTTDAKRDINNAEVFGIILKLKENSISRGEGWRTLIMSYRHGEQVKLNFNQ